LIVTPSVAVEERNIEVDGLPIRYVTAGTGPPLVLLHGAGDNALDWRWVMPDLATAHRVYAPDLPGSPNSARPFANYSPAFFERFVAGFLDALGIERAAMVGNSLGGLVALRLAFSEPARVTALVLVDSAGLGRAVSPALRSLALPGYGKLAVTWSKTPPGALQRALGRAMLLFARPRRIPLKWLKTQYRLGRTPGFSEAQLAAVRAQVGLRGQREVLLDQLPSLQIPTLVVWGSRDRVFPESQARDAVARLRDGSLSLIPECGHMPHIEYPDQFVVTLGEFLG
jgi:pimeloyl-ACP methyl ester carboxylesterase